MEILLGSGVFVGLYIVLYGFKCLVDGLFDKWAEQMRSK